MALRLTESFDGKQRATLKVEFRIDVSSIGEGLIFTVDLNTEVGETEKQLEILQRADRVAALDGTRRMFAVHGFEALGSSCVELPEEVEAAAYERAAELFPEFGGRS